MTLTQTAPAAPPPARRPLARTVAHGVVWGLALAGTLEAVNVLGWRNHHTVLPGVFYRCAQPSPAFLARLIKRHGIRSVVNLRGTCDSAAWFLAEARATRDHDISQWDLAFSAGRLPPVSEVRRLVEVIDHAEYPLVFHCNRGIDRTGMASAVALLLHTDATPDEVRRCLGLRHGHLNAGKTANMDRFFDLYDEWLAETGTPHSRQAFRRWVVAEYCPGACRCEFTLLDPEALRRLPSHEPVGIRVRCTNRSVKPWRMTPGPNAGVHCAGIVFDANDVVVTAGTAGLFHATVEPGESVDLTLPLPALPPGRYSLRVDLHEGQHGFFFQVGSRPLFCELEVL